MAKIRGKKIRNEGQNSSRPPANKFFKKLTTNISVHPSSVPLNNSSENYVLAPVTDNNATSTQNNNEFSGYIFMCSGKTKPECYINRVFGLPSGRKEVVEKINPGTKLFLFDFDSKLLYGVYEASSKGGMNLEPAAFGGQFPAQVRFTIYKEVLPLPLNSFRHAIKDNYQRSKFAPELNSQQVSALLSLYRPINTLSSGPPRYPTPTQLQMRHPSSYGAPQPHMIPAINYEWINDLLATQSQDPHIPYMGPQMHNDFRQGLNPHLHYIRPAGVHLAPPPHSHRPYPSYMGQNSYPMQTAGFGYPQLRPTGSYGGPAYAHPLPHTRMEVSSYNSFGGGLHSMR
ncbi:hypothetical protein LXL04_031973 [Taraxacum kok-saghyz]